MYVYLEESFGWAKKNLNGLLGYTISYLSHFESAFPK